MMNIPSDCKHDPDHAMICLTMRILGWMEFSERTGLGELEGEWQAVEVRQRAVHFE